jgi:hypothetical protein
MVRVHLLIALAVLLSACGGDEGDRCRLNESRCTGNLSCDISEVCADTEGCYGTCRLTCSVEQTASDGGTNWSLACPNGGSCHCDDYSGCFCY